MQSENPIQIVVVKWGEKYNCDIVNRLYSAILQYSSRPVQFICVTDSKGEVFNPGIVKRDFPSFSVDFESLKFGCKPKLGVFASGLLNSALPTILLDLDTVIIGDVARIVDELDNNRGMFMLPNHYLQWWKLPKFIKDIIPNSYYFGSSAICAFYPCDYGNLFDAFNIEVINNKGQKYLTADDRFISYYASDSIRVFSNRAAVKFANEYMAYWLFWEDIRKRLPWIKRRRAGIVAVTFRGEQLKPEKIRDFRNGDIIRHKHLVVRWDFDEITNFYQIPLSPS